MGHKGYPTPCLRPPPRIDVICDIEEHDVPLYTGFRGAGMWDKGIFFWRMNRGFFNRTKRVGRIIDTSVQNLNSPNNNELISKYKSKTVLTSSMIFYLRVFIRSLTGGIPKSMNRKNLSRAESECPTSISIARDPIRLYSHEPLSTQAHIYQLPPACHFLSY